MARLRIGTIHQLQKPFDDDVKDVSRQIRLAFGIKKGYKQRKLPHFQFKILNENTEKIRYELISRAL